MKTFLMTAKFTISGYTKIVAETIEEAIKKAEDQPKMSIVQTGGDNEDETWMFDEIDGEAFDITEEA